MLILFYERKKFTQETQHTKQKTTLTVHNHHKGTAWMYEVCSKSIRKNSVSSLSKEIFVRYLAQMSFRQFLNKCVLHSIHFCWPFTDVVKHSVVNSYEIS